MGAVFDTYYFSLNHSNIILIERIDRKTNPIIRTRSIRKWITLNRVLLGPLSDYIHRIAKCLVDQKYTLQAAFEPFFKKETASRYHL